MATLPSNDTGLGSFKCDWKIMKIKYQERTETDSALAYVDACGDCIQGQGGSNQFIGVAIHCFENFIEDVALEAIEWYNNNKCNPSWQGKELAHKLKDAKAKANMFVAPHKKPEAVIVPTIKVTTSEELPKPIDNATITHLRTCFALDEFVNIAVTNADKKPVNGGEIYTTADWIKTFETTPSVYDVINEPVAKEANGCYVCVNPLTTDEKRSKENVSSYRHLLVEFDTGTLIEQWNIMLASKLPCAVVLSSGNKSLHAWIKINAKNAEEYATRQKIVYNSLASYGVDKQNSDPSRYSRLAGQKRGDKEQQLLAINIGCKSFEEWENDIKYRALRERFPQIKPITEFERPQENDPGELLKHRFLCKEGIMMIIASAGIGKSVMVNQMAITWALGKQCLGITPTRPLKSLIIQAEDDNGDVGEMKDSVFAGMNIIPGSQDEETLKNNVSVVSLNTATGTTFLECMDMYLNDFHPDLVWINPVLAYLGGDANKQETVGALLRNNGLNTLLHKYGAAAIVIHHSAKPLRQGNSSWSISDYTHYGLGSVEWGGVARSMLVILTVDDISHTYIMRSPKRGDRLYWKDPLDYSKYTRDRYIKHANSPGVLKWCEASKDEIISALNAQQKAKESGLKRFNDARKNESRDTILDIIPEAPAGVTRNQIKDETGMTFNTIRKHLTDLLASGDIVETEDIGKNKILSKPKHNFDSQESEDRF